MHQRFDDLPLQDFDHIKSVVYVIDYQWNYLFANRPANEKLNGFQVVGKNIRSVWEENSQFNFQPVYSILKENVEKQIPLFLKTSRRYLASPSRSWGIH